MKRLEWARCKVCGRRLLRPRNELLPEHDSGSVLGNRGPRFNEPFCTSREGVRICDIDAAREKRGPLQVMP